MKIGTWAKVLLAAAPLLAGCGNFWQAPGSSGGGGGGGCTTDCTKATSGNFYILNSPTAGSPTIAGESIITGTLTAISGSPWAVETTPYAIAMAPNGNFLIVSTTTGTYAYPISSGVLGTAIASFHGSGLCHSDRRHQFVAGGGHPRHRRSANFRHLHQLHHRRF